jgi:hypothetical protein
MTKRPLAEKFWFIPALCLLVGAILRLARFPYGDSPAQFDEVSYLSNGLLMLDGETSINKYAPSGPLTWFSAAYGGLRALITLVADKADVAAYPWIIRPAAALQSALFDLYADMTGLRLVVAALTLLLSLAGVAAACRLGKALNGVPGQAIAGLLAACLPIFIEMSTETRPYASAWAFALLALAGAGRANTRTVATGLFLGLAVASHIDMIRIVPLVLLLQWHHAESQGRRLEDHGPPWREFGKTAGVALLAFLVVAPWYMLHFADNIRQIFSVRIFGTTAADQDSILQQWLQAGIAVPLIVTLGGLILAALQRNRPAFAGAIWLILNTLLALHPSDHGLYHDGSLLVMIVALLPLSMAVLSDFAPVLRRPWVAWIAVVLIAGPTVWRGAVTAFAEGRSLEPDSAIAWIEANVPAGTRVYVDSGQFRSLLPIVEAADRLWADAAAPEAWTTKYTQDMAKYGLTGTRPLRVMSGDRLASDRGNRRRFYILGADLRPDIPRYDLWSVSYGGFFDLTPEAAYARLCRDGGIYLHAGAPFPGWPAPTMSWVRADGNSTYIYRIAPDGCGR